MMMESTFDPGYNKKQNMSEKSSPASGVKSMSQSTTSVGRVISMTGVISTRKKEGEKGG